MALLCTAVVLGLTHIPGEAIPRVFSVGGFDKLIHAAAYAMVAASFLFAVDRRAGWRLPVILVVGILALGAIDELTQPFVRRTCSGWDFTTDLIGIALACGVWKTASVRRKAVSVRAAGRRVEA